MLDSAPVTGTTAATELASSITGMNRLGFPATLCSRSGSSSVHPTKVAMAPAVWRMIAPSPMPNKASRARKAPDSTRARRTPGWPSVAVGARAGEDGLAHEERQEAQDQAERRGRRQPMTSALAPKNTGRRGVAASDERMVPLPYSPVMDSTPRTPMTSEPSASPASAALVGSKPW